jgi:hypothetical protein
VNEFENKAYKHVSQFQIISLEVRKERKKERKEKMHEKKKK